MMNVRAPSGAATAANLSRSRSTAVHVAAYRDSRQLREMKLKQRQHVLSTYNKAYAFFPKVKFVLKHHSRVGECWKLSGNTAELGNWTPEVSPTLSWREGGVWSCEVALPPGTYSFKCMLRTADGAYVWESGDNRQVVVPVKDRPGNQIITYHMDVRTDPVETLLPPQQQQHVVPGQYSPMAYPGGVQHQQQQVYERANGRVPVSAW